ncbi:hypothetical protein OQA88_5428 [Cercophora sp. LCS_1]
METLMSNLRYKSRPDLSPPTFNITIPAISQTSPGYIFVTPCALFDAPRTSGPEQPGAHIFTSSGDLVWSSLGFLGGWTANFKATRYRGEPVLQAFTGVLAKQHAHAYGTPVLLDQRYDVVKTVQSLDKLVSFHEFRIVDEKTALVQVHQPAMRDLRAFGGSGMGWIVDDVFQEIDIESGETVFEGRSLCFSDPAESFVPLAPGRGDAPDTAWDYFHTNSVDKAPDGDYLVSGRHMSTVYKVSGRDGSLVWRLGGRQSMFALQEGTEFAYQHDVRHLGFSDDGKTEILSMMDNNARSDEQHPPGEREGRHSRGLVIEVDRKTNTAKALRQFLPPDGLLVGGQGNVQMLKNGNVFVGWGVRGALSEFLGDGTTPFHAYLDTNEGVQSYRGFQCDWEGRPREAVVAVRADHSVIKVWVSWNGDTVTKKWSVFGRGRAVDKHLGDAVKESFESSLEIGAEVAGHEELKVFAVAVDGDDRELGRSNVVDIWEI